MAESQKASPQLHPPKQSFQLTNHIKKRSGTIYFVKKHLKEILFAIFIVFSALIGVIFIIYDSNEYRSQANDEADNYLQEYLCDSQDPPIKLIYQKSPGKVDLDTYFTISLKIANCSNTTLSPGTHALVLKSESTKIKKRIAIPQEVPPNHSLLISSTIKSPATEGPYVFWWQPYTKEKPINPGFAPDIIFATSNYHTCDEVNSLKNTNQDASEAINHCISHAPNNAIIALDPGQYILKNPISLSNKQKNITLTTVGAEDIKTPCLVTEGKDCAILTADPDIPSQGDPNIVENMSLLRFSNLEQITLAHLVIDGNQKNRNRKCAEIAGGQRQNIVIQNDNSQIFYNAITNALCGTGISLGGHKNYLIGNYIANNGYHPDDWILSNKIHTVADGASLVGSKATVKDNIFHNNTDVDLIAWGSTGSKIMFNQVIHDNPNYAANAGIMLSTDSIPNNKAVEDLLGNHQDTIISYNKIDCPHKLCGYGIQLGLKSWSQSYPSTTGGEVTHNVVNGGIVGINIDGAGTLAYPLKIGSNIVKNSGGVSSKVCSYPTTGSINQAPKDVVKYLDNTKPDTNFAWDCKSASCYFDKNYCSKAVTCSSYEYSNWSKCENNIQTRSVSSKNSSCVGGKKQPTLFRTCFPQSEKIIKGAVFCIDRDMPVETGQVRGIKNAVITAVVENSPKEELITTEDGYFTLNKVLDNFSLYVTDFSKSTYLGKPFGGVENMSETYVVANAQAAQAKCDNISENKGSGLIFQNCKINLLPKVSDGFAFVAGECPDKNRAGFSPKSTPIATSAPIKPSPTPLLNEVVAKPSPSLEPTFRKTIRGAVYCYDYDLPKESGYTRGIKNSQLSLSDQKQTYTTISDENGIFVFDQDLTAKFNLVVSDISQATDRNQLISTNKPYVVANAQAARAKCTINQGEALSFNDCQTPLLDSVSDGFAFIVGPCN